MTTLIKSINLRVKEYGDDKGKFLGDSEFLNQHGEIRALLAENLVATAKETAALITAKVLSQAENGGALIEG